MEIAIGPQTMQDTHRWIWIVVYTLAATFTGLTAWSVYLLATQPFLAACTGGAARSYPAAGTIGVLLAAAGLVAVVLTRRFLLAYAGFAVGYPLALMLLAIVSPLLWGHMTCIETSFVE
jgi:hypothetical protein